MPATKAKKPGRPAGAAGNTARRIDKIARVNRAKRYLEVGVAKGHTFHLLDFPLMHAVDPRFKFDVNEFKNSARSYFEIPSDAFFRDPPDNKPYDVMFLDGLHTFEQTFRDFCASVAVSHPRSIWLIDDTIPSDEHSAMRDMGEALASREKAGGTGGAWHGDVYKCVFAIHDFFPNISYRTIVGSGNPQTIAIRLPRADFAPRWNDLAAISALTYADFTFNRDLLKPCTEAEAMQWLRESLPKPAAKAASAGLLARLRRKFRVGAAA